jgi:hypothetical protein
MLTDYIAEQRDVPKISKELTALKSLVISSIYTGGDPFSNRISLIWINKLLKAIRTPGLEVIKPCFYAEVEYNIRELLDDRTIQWKRFATNVVADCPSMKSLVMHFEIETKLSEFMKEHTKEVLRRKLTVLGDKLIFEWSTFICFYPLCID